LVLFCLFFSSPSSLIFFKNNLMGYLGFCFLGVLGVALF